ncbi:MAG: hypothetical protein V4736_14380 [Bdellovibrionota bacterium]
MQRVIISFCMLIGTFSSMAIASDVCLDSKLRFNSHLAISCPDVNSICLTDYIAEVRSTDLVLKKDEAVIASYPFQSSFVENYSDVAQEIGFTYWAQSDDNFISLLYPNDGFWPATVTGELHEMVISTGKTNSQGGVYLSQICTYTLGTKAIK